MNRIIEWIFNRVKKPGDLKVLCNKADNYYADLVCISIPTTEDAGIYCP